MKSTLYYWYCRTGSSCIYQKRQLFCAKAALVLLHLIFFFPGIKGKGKGMVKEELKGPEVCKDPVRLTTYAVGVNIYKEGDDPKLKNPEEYPGW